MRSKKYSELFAKKLNKLKGQELENIINKMKELVEASDINHYKNLKYDLKKFKRIHVNKSFVILFFCENNTIYFIDYEHHDKIYKKVYTF